MPVARLPRYRRKHPLLSQIAPLDHRMPSALILYFDHDATRFGQFDRRSLRLKLTTGRTSFIAFSTSFERTSFKDNLDRLARQIGLLP